VFEPGTAQPNSDVEADVALSRCAPSGPRSLTPVVRQTQPTDGVCSERSGRALVSGGTRVVRLKGSRLLVASIGVARSRMVAGRVLDEHGVSMERASV
jgi:hypothetical protein